MANQFMLVAVGAIVLALLAVPARKMYLSFVCWGDTIFPAKELENAISAKSMETVVKIFAEYQRKVFRVANASKKNIPKYVHYKLLVMFPVSDLQIAFQDNSRTLLEDALKNYRNNLIAVRRNFDGCLPDSTHMHIMELIGFVDKVMNIIVEDNKKVEISLKAAVSLK